MNIRIGRWAVSPKWAAFKMGRMAPAHFGGGSRKRAPRASSTTTASGTTRCNVWEVWGSGPRGEAVGMEWYLPLEGAAPRRRPIPHWSGIDETATLPLLPREASPPSGSIMEGGSRRFGTPELRGECVRHGADFRHSDGDFFWFFVFLRPAATPLQRPPSTAAAFTPSPPQLRRPREVVLKVFYVSGRPGDLMSMIVCGLLWRGSVIGPKDPCGVARLRSWGPGLRRRRVVLTLSCLCDW